jgi:hypothetical protein
VISISQGNEFGFSTVSQGSETVLYSHFHCHLDGDAAGITEEDFGKVCVSAWIIPHVGQSFQTLVVVNVVVQVVIRHEQQSTSEHHRRPMRQPPEHDVRHVLSHLFVDGVV